MMNSKNDSLLIRIIAGIVIFGSVLLILACGDKVTSTTDPEFAYEGIWVDEFTAYRFESFIIVDSVWIPKCEATIDTIIKTPMKSVLTIEPDFFDVRIYANDTELANNFGGVFECSADTLTFIAEGIGTFIFGNVMYGRDSIYMYDFMYSDTAKPIIVGSQQRFLLWDCGSYSMIQESRGVFHRIDD